jgi:hypothetical protein
MVAVVVAAAPLAAWDRVLEAYDAYRFHQRRDTCDVTGVITAIDRQAGRVAITIGSDDGIVSGEVLYLFRGEANPHYLGKIRIDSVQDDSAMGQIISRSCGLAIREGDGVAHLTWVKRRFRLCGYALRSPEPPN